MARITVEDCLKKLPNKFELSVLASYRAKEISKGAAIQIERNNDKNSVISLREIASEHINANKLKQAYIQSLQLHIASNDVPTEDVDKSEKKLHIDAKDDIVSDELMEREFISLDEDEEVFSEIEDLEIDSVIDDISEEDEEK
jgi:DNA-directed RNA polymerase subunit omega